MHASEVEKKKSKHGSLSARVPRGWLDSGSMRQERLGRAPLAEDLQVSVSLSRSTQQFPLRRHDVANTREQEKLRRCAADSCYDDRTASRPPPGYLVLRRPPCSPSPRRAALQKWRRRTCILYAKRGNLRTTQQSLGIEIT